ncbi:MAG: hypothetical protein ACT4N5_01420 [Nitrosopumilaceae archaeon]
MIEQDVQINSSMSNAPEKELEHVDMLSENEINRCRGPDKKPRRINPISIQNLKQYQRNNESDTEMVENTDKTIFNSKILTGVIIFFGIVIGGAIIWKIYSHYSDNRPK